MWFWHVDSGTAASASSAAQVLYDALVMFLAAQCLSVLAIDALRANLEPFEPFPHTHSRPHPGQIDVAANIKRMARNSKMCFEVYPNGDPEFLLRQDRYHIRWALFLDLIFDLNITSDVFLSGWAHWANPLFMLHGSWVLNWIRQQTIPSSIPMGRSHKTSTMQEISWLWVLQSRWIKFVMRCLELVSVKSGSHGRMIYLYSNWYR